MRIVVLTNNESYYGKRLIQELERSGVKLTGIVILKQPISYQIKLFKFVEKKVGLVEAFYFAIQAIIKSMLKKKQPLEYDSFKTPKFLAKANNKTDLVSQLQSLSPDLILLGQTGIIRQNIIEIPSLGVLNAHPGMLPKYRGIDCLRWAIYNDESHEIGASVHWVDKGVDTGDIVSTRQFKISSKFSLDELDDQLSLHCIQLLVETVKALDVEAKPESQKQHIADGKQYYKMSLSKERKTKQRLNNIGQ